MKKILVLISFILLNITIGKSQNLLPERKVNWNEIINHHVFNYPVTEYNFLSEGGSNDGVTSNDLTLSNLLNNIDTNGAIIYFPAGEYFFNSTIVLKSNVILRGENATSTTLKFNLQGANNLIEISGNTTTIQSNFTTSQNKESYNIQLENNSLFSANDYIKIIDNDADKITSTWAAESTGQIIKIQSIDANNIITLNSALRRDYLFTNNPKVVKITPIHNVGIENITINRIDATTSQTSHINMNYAVNCKINCIKSYNSNFAHIALSNSSNCKIEGSYFQDAFAYGGGGQGYGVVLQFTTGECLVYNNTFKHLRHSILFQAGANGNVIGYNYSRDPFWTETISNAAGDLVLHGNYPYCNLMEGNIVQNIVIDNSHGINGPYNTFLRNRGELYGIFMNSGAGNSQNFISNEVTNTGFFLGLYTITGTDHFQYGNNVKGTIYASGTTLSTENSMYLTSSLPYYSSNSFWPPIGIISNYNTYINESKARYNSNVFVQCDNNLLSQELDTNLISNTTLFPNPATNNITVNNLNNGDFITIVDVSGKVYKTILCNQEKTFTVLIDDLASGFYFLIINKNFTNQRTIKFIKQ